MLPKGLICPLLVPLKKTGEIDAIGLKQLYEHVAGHVAAISLGSSLSLEGIYLNPEQKQALFRLISGIWDGRVPLFLDITGDDESCTLHLAQLTTSLFQEHQGQVFIEILPLWYHSNRGLPAHLDKIYTQTKANLILVNHPAIIRQKKPLLKFTHIRTSVFKKIVERPYVKALIFQGPLSQFFNYNRALHDRRDFVFYEADELSFLNQPNSDGIVALTANLIPDIWQRLVEQVLNLKGQGLQIDPTETLSLAARIKELHQIDGYLPAVLKWALVELGILEDAYTPNACLNGETLVKLKKWLKEIDKI